MPDSPESSLFPEDQEGPLAMSPKLNSEAHSDPDNSIYNIPPSILKRLTPVSPQKKKSAHEDIRRKMLTERKQKLKEYSIKVDRINKNQKWLAEKRRRYSNEALQEKLDKAHERRVQSYSAKSKRASESFKLIKSDDSLTKAVTHTKSILRNCDVGIINEQCTFPIERNLISKAICKYFVRQKIQILLKSRLFDLVSDVSVNDESVSSLTSPEVVNSVSFIFRNLSIPLYNDCGSKVFLQSVQYIIESFSEKGRMMNALVTTLPKLNDREPFKSVFDNKLNADLIPILIQVSKQLVTSFKFFIQSDLNKFSHQYLVFIKLWKKFNDLNSIFIKFHSIRCILNLNYSVQVLSRSQQILKLKLKDYAYVTVKEELIKDIQNYDVDMNKLKRQLSIFKKDAKMPCLNDIYFIAKILKDNKRVYNSNDMYPSFLKSMKNWRQILIYEEFNNRLELNKNNCDILNTDFKTDLIYISKYEKYCRLLNLENFLETLSMDQELTEFGIRICDFLNNSLNANTIFPPLELSISNFRDFFQKVIVHGFKDILKVEDVENYKKLLARLDTDRVIEQAKEFLIKLVRTSITFIISSNLPRDKILFEKYQFGRKFEILNCPLLVGRCFRSLRKGNSLEFLIMSEICNLFGVEGYQLMESLQIFRFVIEQHIPFVNKSNNLDKIKNFLLHHEMDQSLSEFKEDLVVLKKSLHKLIELNIKCYGNIYEEVWGYLESNWV